MEEKKPWEEYAASNVEESKEKKPWEEYSDESSPKSNAPSNTGGESGARITPSTSTLPSAGSKSESWTKTINPLAGTGATRSIDAVQTNKIVEPKKVGEYKPLVQENIQKIEGMTMGVKFTEYSKPSTKQTFDFKQASQEAVSEEQKSEKEQTIKRKEQRRIDNLPSEIESLRKERADLLLDRSPEAKRKLAANQAVTEKMQSDLDNISKSKYESLQNLNQRAIKNVELEINEYLENNPKLRDEIKVKGLTDSETYALVQQSVAKKIAPLEADLQTFQQEGTVENARKKVEISGNLQSKQKKIEGLAEQLKSYQDEYLKKAGFSDLNNQLNSSMQALKKYEPYLNKAKAEAIGYKKELTQIESKLNAYQSKIEGNSFNGTQQELNDYKALKKDYNETINEFNNVYENESLNGYEEAVNNYNSLAAKRSSIVKGLQNNEYNTIKTQYDAQIAEYDLALNDYKKFEEPEIKDRINKYFSTVQQIGDYDQKVKTTRGELASIDELEKAKKTFSNAGGGTDVLDIGGRAVNSILGAAKKLVASPFRIAGSLSDVYGSGGDVYHYSDFVADLIEGKGSEPLFLTKEKNVFYDSVTDKINWGAVPVLASMADQAGVLLVLALTGKYATPTVASAMTTAGTDLTAAAEIAESAKIATTIAPAFMISYGDNYKEALDKGFSAGGAMAYSGALSFLEGLTETILPDQDLLFGKGAKDAMLNRFIKDYAKGKNFAIKNMTNDFLFNAFGEATEEGIAALGKTSATSIGHLVDNDISVEIPTMNQNITTSITAGLTGGGMGIVGSVSENSQMYKMGVMQLANDFETGKALLSKLNEKGKIDDKRYNKLISDVQKFQSVRGQIPEGLSGFKTMAVFEKMIAIKELSAQMDKDKTNPFNKINAKKISAIQDEIEKIVDDKNFDARAEYELNLEAEELGKPQEEKQETSVNPTLQKNTSPTPEKYGTINRNDGKGVVNLTKEEFEAEQANMQPKAEGIVPVEKPTDEQIAKDIKDRNFATFTYESESEVPEVLKDRISSTATTNGKTTIRVTLPKSEADYLLQQQATPEAIAGETIKTKTNEKANEDGEQKRGKDGKEDVPKSVQSEGEIGGNEVDLKEKQVLAPEGAVTAAPIENPKVVIQGTRQGLETFESSNYDSKADGKVTDARGLKFDENGVSIQKDNKGNQIVHIAVDATDVFNRAGKLQVSVIVPEGTNVNTKAIKEIVDAKVAEIKAKGNIDLKLGKVQQSDFTALKDAIVNELKNPSAAKSKAEAALNEEAGGVGVGGDVETYFNENTRSTQDSKYNPDLSGEGEMALREQENRLLELGADRIQAHGLAKGSIGQQFKDLINILTKGLDSRGGGQLYTAPLVMPTELRAGAGAALGTGGGTAYTDGGFIILAREGVNEIRSIDDIGGVLVNQAVADSLPELVDRLKKQFPNISIESYSNSPKAIESIKSKAVEQSLKETPQAENKQNEVKNPTPPAVNIEAPKPSIDVIEDDNKVEVKDEVTPKDKVWSKTKAYNNLTKTERKSTYGSKLRSEIMSEAAALGYTVKPTKQGKYILVDEKGKEIRNVGTPRSKDAIQEEKRKKERRSRARRELPISVKHSVAQDIANGVQFDREELKKVTGLRDNEIPFWMTRTDGKGETLEFYNQKYQEKGGAYVEDDMDFQSQVGDAIGEFAHKQGRTSALEYIETIQEKLENGGLTDAEMKEQAAEYQAELDEANFDYFAEYLSNLSDAEAQQLADQLREAEAQENQLIINEILNENGKENKGEAEQGKQKTDTKTPDTKGKSETITALEEELSNIEKEIAKKQAAMQKLTKDEQADMFAGAKIQMFDNAEILKNLTNEVKDLRQKANEVKAKIEIQLEKEANPVVEQPKNQLDIEKEAAKAEGVTEFGKAMSASSRFRPYETVVFDKPIIGENGNKLISYQWAYEWQEVENNEGEAVPKRFSDWTQAENSAETGRDIVHKFTIEKKDGTIVTVSSETVPSLLGYVDEKQMKSIPQLATAVKTLAKQRMQLAIMEAKQKEYEELLDKYTKAQKPPIVMNDYSDGGAEFTMGDSWVMQNEEFDYYDKEKGKSIYKKVTKINEERKAALESGWIQKRIEEEGGKRQTGLYDLKNRVARQEKKVEQITGSKISIKDVAPSKEKVEQVKPKTAKETAKEKLTDPKNASDLAKTYRNKFGFTPQRSVWAARLFDAKAAFMSKVLGISKEDYYSQYWFGVNEGEGGLSQMTLPDGRKVTVKNLGVDVINGFYSPLEKTINETKFDKLPAKQWIDKFAKGEEAKWTGLNEWLNQQQGSVSKADIQQFLKDNRIQVVEVVKGEAEDAGYDNFQKQVEKAERKFGVRINIDENPMDGSPDVQISGEKLDNMTDDEIQELQDEVTDFVMAEAPDTENNTKFSQYQLEGKKSNYKEVLVTMPTNDTVYTLENADGELEYVSKGKKQFKSSHFDEPNILVHLRMNTRTDAEGNKVLFLEEVQSDWGQKGKKEGFSLTSEEKSKLIEKHRGVLAELQDIDAKIIEAVDNKNIGKNIFQLTERKQELLDLSEKLKDQIFRNKAPQAPFVMDTNAWTKLGLKVALKEAVKQGADKIAWTTGEQQNDRYDLSKQVKQVEWNKYTERGAVKLVTITPTTGNVIELPIDENGFVSNNAGTQFDGQRIDNIIGKEIGDKIVSENSGDLSGNNLKVGGKGMKGFYGSPTEGSLGIVGNVAKSLFKQVPKTVKLGKGEYIKDEEGNIIGRKGFQNSIDITPELKAEAEQGQPLFQDRKGSWTKDAVRMKRIINMYEKADSTTAVHEMLGHDYLDRIIEASATNKEFEADLRTIADEYIKDTKSKEKVEDIIKALKDFDVEKNPSIKGRKIHEWFATQAEQYFATEKDVKRETPQQSKMAKIFEAFRAHLAELYDIMNKTLIAPSEPMKQVFRKVFGEENFNKAEEIRAENVKAINSLNAAALEGNKKAGGLKSLADKLKEKGLGQSEFAQDIWDAASELIANGKAKRYNVTDALKEMFPAIEGDIESMRKVLQEIGTTGKLRQGAENILANPTISDEVKEKVAKMSEYTPEKLKQVGLSTNEVIDYYIGEYGEVAGLEKIKSLLDKGEFDGYTEKVAIQQSLIGMYNKLAKFGATEQIRKEALNNAVDVAEQYINQGTSLGRAINAYKLLGSLTTEGRLVWAKRQTNKYVKPAHEALKENIRDLKAELKDAYKQVDYFFEQTLGREETEGQYKEAIAQYQAEIDALKARKPREPKPSKTAYKGVKATREFRESDLANFAKDILAGGLFQDMETMTAPQKLAYGIMEKKPTNISEFAKAFGRYLGKKIDPKELESLYVQTRDLLITKDLAFADGLSTNEQLRADLDGLEVANKAKIEELERKKAEAEAKIAAKAKKGEKKEHSEELADFVIKDAKKAMNGAIAKQKTYLDEILKALKEKVGDVVKKGEKNKVHTAKVSEVEAIKFALDAINNGGADANMWNDAVEQVKAKIKADNDLSQQDKDDLNLYLNDYTAFLYDNLLSENKIFKVIREKLIQSGYGNGTLVNWKQIIEGADGDVNNMREIIQKLVKNQLKDYDNVQVEKVLDAIVYKYDQEINKQRKKIADKYIEKELGDKKSTKKKTAAVQGKIGKLLVENRLGILKDGNNDMLNELAVAKGLQMMSAADWKTARQLAENVENSADGNLKNQAIEEMTAFIASKQPLSFMDTASAIRFAGLLGRPITALTNLLGNISQGGIAAVGMVARLNFSFIPQSTKGINKGNFNDIFFSGGINQSSKTSVEVNNTGMPYFRPLEYGKKNKYISSGKYVSRVLDATDATFQQMFTDAYDPFYLAKYFKIENPTATKSEIDAMVKKALSVSYDKGEFDAMFKKQNPNATQAEIDILVNEALKKTQFDEFYAQALQDVIKSGKKPTPANVKRRTYEILRESKVPPIVRELANMEADENTFKSELKDNLGIATLTGMLLQKSLGVPKFAIDKMVNGIIFLSTKKGSYNEETAKLIANKIGEAYTKIEYPFVRGVANVYEKGLELELVYGLSKSIIKAIGATRMPETTVEERMHKVRVQEKAKSLAANAIAVNILMYGLGAAIANMGDDDESEEEKKERLSIKGMKVGKDDLGGNTTAKERSEAENTLTVFGHKIPLMRLAGLGIAMGIDANIYEALTKKDDPKKVYNSAASKRMDKIAEAGNKVVLSLMQNPSLMGKSERQSLMYALYTGGTEKFFNVLENNVISYVGSYMLWSGFVNQSLQGARYLSGDKSYQEAKTLSEKVQKQMGLAGLTYDNKRPNYMGRTLEATEVNREGIQGFIAMFSRDNKPKIEKWVESVGYKESLVGRKSKQLATIESESFVSPTNEQYDDFTDNTRKLIGKGIEFAYSKRNEVVVPLGANGGLEVNKKTGKAYTADEYTNELLNDMSNAIEGYKRTELVNRLDANKYDRDEYLSKLKDYYYKLEDAMYEFYIKGSLSTKESKEEFSDKVNSILPPPPKE